MMQVKPVMAKREPCYPTSDYLRDHPELLRLVPTRWRSNRLVLAVLGGAVSLILGAQAEAQDAKAGPRSHVAPIFVHGAGRGSFGCEVVNPPVFLSEDEARQVIEQEARKAGLEFVRGAFRVTSTRVPVTHYTFAGCQNKPATEQTRDAELILDGFDQRKKVAYKFVSMGDFARWRDERLDCASTIRQIDLKTPAAVLRKGLARTNTGAWVGVFYDPAGAVSLSFNPSGPAENYWKELETASRQNGVKDLRAQVRDFIAWLKAQGVI